MITAPTNPHLVRLNSRRSLVDRGSEGIELRSLALDIAPRSDGESETMPSADATSIGVALSSMAAQGVGVSGSGPSADAASEPAGGGRGAPPEEGVGGPASEDGVCFFPLPRTRPLTQTGSAGCRDSLC